MKRNRSKSTLFLTIAVVLAITAVFTGLALADGGASLGSSGDGQETLDRACRDSDGWETADPSATSAGIQSTNAITVPVRPQRCSGTPVPTPITLPGATPTATPDPDRIIVTPGIPRCESSPAAEINRVAGPVNARPCIVVPPPPGPSHSALFDFAP